LDFGFYLNFAFGNVTYFPAPSTQFRFGQSINDIRTIPDTVVVVKRTISSSSRRQEPDILFRAAGARTSDSCCRWIPTAGEGRIDFGVP